MSMNYQMFFEQKKYLLCLENVQLLDMLARNYLMEYQDNVNIEMLVFKEALDQYVCTKIRENQNFLRTTLFKNYIQYLKIISQKKVYIFQNNNSKLMLPLEFSINIFFQNNNDQLINEYFQEIDVKKTRQFINDYLSKLFHRMKSNNLLSNDELIIVADYLNNQKDINEEEKSIFIHYLINNIQRISINNTIKSAIIMLLSKRRIYASNKDINLLTSPLNYYYFHFDLQPNLETIKSFKQDFTLNNEICLFNLIRQVYFHLYQINIQANKDVLSLYFSLNQKKNNINDYSEITLSSDTFAWTETLKLYDRELLSDNLLAYYQINKDLLTIKKILAFLPNLYNYSEYLSLTTINKEMQNNLFNPSLSRQISLFWDYQGQILPDKLFNEIIYQDFGYQLIAFLLENVSLSYLSSSISNGLYSEKNINNFLHNIFYSLQYSSALLQNIFQINSAIYDFYFKEKNQLSSYFSIIVNQIIKIEDIFKILELNNISIGDEHLQKKNELITLNISEMFKHPEYFDQNQLLSLYNAFKEKNNQLLVNLIKEKSSIDIEEKHSKEEKELNNKAQNKFFSLKVKPFIQKKKWLLVGGFSCLLILLGFYFYWTKTDKITLDNAQMYPAFDKSITQYIIYTKSNDIKFNCHHPGYQNCNKKVELLSDELNYQIAKKDTIYQFKIYKLKETEASVKISDIKGIPTSWVNETYLSVVLDNPEYISAEYSFDGGKTYSSNHEIKVVENQTYNIVVRDYFGFETPSKYITIDKIDNELPQVKIESERLTDNSLLLKAVASDKISGIKKYVWNNKVENKSLKVYQNGTYDVLVYDKAGNSKREQITIKEKEKEFNISFYNDGKTSKVSCQSFANYCEIDTLPINGSSNMLLGWATKKDADDIEYKPKQKIKINSNMSLYAIKKRQIKAQLIIQDKNAVSQTVSEAICTYLDNETSCTIELPNLKANNGYEIIGWSLEPNKTSATITNHQKVRLDKNVTYYLVTKKSSPLVASFILQDSNLSTSSKNVSCLLYNGAKECSIDVPTLSSKSSNVRAIGWNTNNYAVNANTTKTVNLTKNTSFYSVSSRPLTVDKEKGTASIKAIHIKKYRNVNLEIEDGINEQYFKSFLALLNALYNDYTQLFTFKGNIVLMQETTYNKLNSSSVGITYNFSTHSNVYILANASNYSNNYYLFATAHELFHTYDYNFYKYFHKMICENSDVINLYKKYANMNKNTRPLRDYSYTIVEEFLADAFASFYAKEKNNKYYLSSLGGNAITSDISDILKKYLNEGYNYFKSRGII